MTPDADRWVAWHEARFPESTALLVAGKLVEEIGELWSALLVEDGRTTAKTDGDVLAEAANALGCLIVLVHRWGYGDLFAEMRRQLDDLMSPTSAHRSSLAAHAARRGQS